MKNKSIIKINEGMRARESVGESKIHVRWLFIVSILNSISKQYTVIDHSINNGLT